MRIYYFRQSAAGTVTVTTYPVGLGRDDWRTPEGKFKITQKDVNPTWVLPESIKAEHRRDGKPAPTSSRAVTRPTRSDGTACASACPCTASTAPTSRGALACR